MERFRQSFPGVPLGRLASARAISMRTSCKWSNVARSCWRGTAWGRETCWRSCIGARAYRVLTRRRRENMTTDPSCVFCKIVNGEIPAKKVHEDEHILAFHDVRPQAAVHFLIADLLGMPPRRGATVAATARRADALAALAARAPGGARRRPALWIGLVPRAGQRGAPP